ncbi:uncharacterized protein LOC144357703 [Saccoglossus kowalevskii]
MAYLITTTVLMLCLVSICYAQSTCDLNVYGVTVIEPDPNNGQISYYSGRDTYTELSIVIINNGPDTLPADLNGDNYELVLSLEYTDTIMTYPFEIDMEFSYADEANMAAELLYLDSMSYTPNATVAVPTWQCGNLTSMCVSLVKTTTAYVDLAPDNDFYCLQWGDGATSAGILSCTAGELRVF